MIQINSTCNSILFNPICTIWNGSTSQSNKITNGVTQGGVPEYLESKGEGCHMGIIIIHDVLLQQ